MKRVAAILHGRARRRRLADDVRGNAAIEVALTLPAVLLFVFGIIEFGEAVWLQNALDYSVAEAARCASINLTDCGTTAQIQSYASNQSGYSFDNSIFLVSTPTCGNQVSAAYPMALTIPYLALSVTLTAHACYPS